MAAPLARRYLIRSWRWFKEREWRVYHLERLANTCFKIVLSSELAQGDHLSFETMLRRWEEEARSCRGAAETLSSS